MLHIELKTDTVQKCYIPQAISIILLRCLCYWILFSTHTTVDSTCWIKIHRIKVPSLPKSFKQRPDFYLHWAWATQRGLSLLKYKSKKPEAKITRVQPQAIQVINNYNSFYLTIEIMCIYLTIRIKGICIQVSIDTLDPHTLNRYSINNSVDTQLTLSWHLNQQSVECLLIFADKPLSVDQHVWVGQHWWLTIDTLLIEHDPAFIRRVLHVHASIVTR